MKPSNLKHQNTQEGKERMSTGEAGQATGRKHSGMEEGDTTITFTDNKDITEDTHFRRRAFRPCRSHLQVET